MSHSTVFYFLMIRRPPRSTRTDTLFPTRRSSELRRHRLGTGRAGDAASRPGGTGRVDSRMAGRLRNLPHHPRRSEEHTSELQSLMRISYAVFCLQKQNTNMTSGKVAENTDRKLHSTDQLSQQNATSKTSTV